MKLQAKAVGLVAGVAVAAVGVSAFVVARQVPTLDAGDRPAGPIGTAGPTGTPDTPTPTTQPTPSPTGSPTPTGKPSSTPTSTGTGLTGPTIIELEPTSYRRGAAPSIPYTEQNSLVDGDTRAKVSAPIWAGARTTTGVLVVVSPGADRTELQVFDDAGRLVRRVPGVTTVKSSADSRFSAYATGDPSEQKKGSVVTWQTGSQTRRLSRPDDYGLRVLYVDAGFVYFSSRTTVGGVDALYRWKIPGTTVERRAGVTRPTAISPNGLQVSMVTSVSDEGSCSRVVDAANTRISYWSTCAFSIHSFSPRGKTVLAGGAYADGYGEAFAAVLENSTGKVLRKWQGTVLGSAYEDEDHVLIVADADDDRRGAIVRCAISTGACELATPLGKGGQDARADGQAAGLP